jgi:sugar O-acyltransferase (sialic acid O-acetyltransferase NeuD family)
MKNKVIIFGVGNTAELAFYYLNEDTSYECVAFTLEKEFIKNDKFFDLPVVSFEDIESIYSPDEYNLFAPITGTQLNKFRERIYNSGKNKGYTFISYISSKAIVLTKNIGDICFILENNTIQHKVKIGNNCVLWSGNHIGHHSTIHDHVFLTSHVVICGLCTIKSYCWIGVNSSIKDGLILDEGTVIGMGSVVTKNTNKNSIYIGVPAKLLKECDDTIIL